jgi:hypothetical protein
MPRYSIIVERAGLGTLSPNPIGIDGLRALSAIPGVEDARIENESENRAEISY